MKLFRRVTNAAVLVAALTLTSSPSQLFAQNQVTAAPEQAGTDALARQLWLAAKAGDNAKFEQAVARMADLDPKGPKADLAAAATSLKTNLAQRETNRAAREKELRDELAKNLAETNDYVRLSKSLRSAIELEMLAVKKGHLAAEPQIATIVTQAVASAKDSESRGDVLNASELFGLLNGLFEETGTYHGDVERLGQRLAMLRLYAPKKLYDLRLERLKALGEDAKMPPYNSLGDDFTKKLAGIDQVMLIRAIAFSVKHVEKPKQNDLLIGGLENLKTLATTNLLEETFPKIGDRTARAAILAFLDGEQAKIRASDQAYDLVQIEQLLERLRRINNETLELPTTSLLHEFGNGVMSPLDEYSVIIWPDEVRRFQKNTQGRFVGVGVQIEYDDQSRIKIATPLEGTPAQRAGIHSNDILAAVNGKNVFGLTLDQVVDVITGPAGTPVTLTIERPNTEKADAPGRMIDFQLERSFIEVPSAKGWIRSGEREDAWDYMIDAESGIGYIRLGQFTETTGDEIAAAVAGLQSRGMKGLIFDLRFNPGGLLDQAVKVSRKFIKVEGGVVVQARGATGAIENSEYTRPTQASLAKTPIIVLINEGSASASEIVSGAISCYAKSGDLDAILLGARSFGKGSVQNVWQLTSNSHLKLTVQYYMLPDKSIIHRRVGATTWGVQPNLTVEMLPKQTTDGILLRRDADVIPINENGIIQADLAKRANPTDLITKGLDLQLESALLLMKARVSEPANQAQADR